MKKLSPFLILFLIQVNSGLFACSCIGQRTTVEELKYSDAVLTGKIISKNLVKLLDPTAIEMSKVDISEINFFPYATIVVKYELLITNTFKGTYNSEIVEIYTGIGNGDCGVEFVVGEEYLIYGNAKTYFGTSHNNFNYPKGEHIIWTNSCSRTKIINKGEITELEKHLNK